MSRERIIHQSKRKEGEMDFIDTITCKLFHRDYHHTRILSDGMSFHYSAGECVRCGRRWGGGRLAVNYIDNESRILTDTDQPPDGWEWFKLGDNTNVYVNNKTGETYIYVMIIDDKTNSMNGRQVVLYRRNGGYYIRDKDEFFEKFSSVGIR